MARNDGRIEPGQKLAGAISARAWNRAQDAADRVLGAGTGVEAGPLTFTSAPYQWVYAKNGTASTVNRWGIMSITGVEVTPTSDATAAATVQFQSMPVITGGTPAATTTAWCVAVEPIESNKIGRVAVAGVVQCKLDVTNADDKFAACKASASELKTGTSGEATILWKDSGTGSGKWAFVRFGGVGAGGGVRLGTISATWTKGNTATVTEQNGDGTAKSPTTTFEAKNYFATVSVTSGTKRVACAKVDDTWILLAAEC
jgi:hypothetical protein